MLACSGGFNHPIARVAIGGGHFLVEGRFDLGGFGVDGCGFGGEAGER